VKSDRKPNAAQTIGRGLRLPVNQHGDRVHDVTINRLTVIARESYESFAENLQKEYERDLDMKFGVVPFEAFATLVVISNQDTGQPRQEVAIGQESARVLWDHLLQRGYLDAAGLIQPKFDPGYAHFELDVPPEFVPLRAQVVDTMQRFVFKNRIGDARKRGPRQVAQERIAGSDVQGIVGKDQPAHTISRGIFQ